MENLSTRCHANRKTQYELWRQHVCYRISWRKQIHRLMNNFTVLLRSLTHMIVQAILFLGNGGKIKVSQVLQSADIQLSNYRKTNTVALLQTSAKNRGYFVLHPITFVIFNRCVPNLAKITFISFCTPYYNLFNLAWENSGAIWWITLTVNKKVINGNDCAMR